MAQDTFQRAKERYDDAREAWRENFDRMAEDLEFSNPADPKQWDEDTLDERGDRITLTLDQTNQFLQQVVNDARQNTPSITVVPGDYLADKRVAQEQGKRLRYLEYVSRAAIAYDTSVEYSARNGLGWLRFLPVVVDGKLKFQEPRILAVHDPLAACLDGDSVEFDGSDAVDGFIESTMSERAFKAAYPGKRLASFGDSDGWFSQQGARVAEWFNVEVLRGNKITTGDKETGENQVEYTEDEYWQASAKLGYKPHVIKTDPQAELGRKVMWRKMSGCEILEEVEFPCRWIGLIPVYGQVVWIKGKRYVSGLTRRLMDGQRLHNYANSSVAEALLEQPKAPFIASARAIKGHEAHWQRLNDGSPSYLPFNDLPDNDDDPPIEKPQRLAPPAFPAAWGTLSQIGVQAMQAGVGMYKSNLGQQSNAVSGRAKVADKIEGDTATFHYVDNQRRSLEQLGRALLDMDRRLVDTRRTVRTLSVDDKPGMVEVDPEMAEAVRLDARGRVVAINPAIGQYDTRVKAGPGYTTLREELKDRLTQLGQTNPALAAALAPILVKLDDLPEADKVMRVCLALLPPNVQEAYKDDEDEGGAVSPEARAALEDMRARLEQAGAMLQDLAGQLQEARAAADDAALKARELDIKAREVEVKATEADTRAAEAAAKAQQAEADRLRAELEGPAYAAALEGITQQIAEVVAQMQSDVRETQQQAAEAIDQLGARVERPRVAEIEYDENGRPVRAVGVLQ